MTPGSRTSVAAAAGEIIPQALCTRYGLQIGAYSAWFVLALMAVTSPLTYPISKVLDYMLGTEHGVRLCSPAGMLSATAGKHPELLVCACFKVGIRSLIYDTLPAAKALLKFSIWGPQQQCCRIQSMCSLTSSKNNI